MVCEISQTAKIEAWGGNSGRTSKDKVDRLIQIVCRKVMLGFGCIAWGSVVDHVKLYGSSCDSRWFAKFRKLLKSGLEAAIAADRERLQLMD